MSGSPDDAARWAETAARHGFRSAQVLWGQMLLDGRGAARDRVAAFGWFSRAASLGDPEGTNMVGRCHELGWGVPADHRTAAAFYRRAADRGSSWGLYNLACMFLYGDGDRDPAEALHLFRSAAEAGHAKAAGMLGRFHEEGWTVPVDVAAARRWYETAAEGGDCWGAYNLARSLSGTGGDRDRVIALIRRSIETGTPNFLATVARDLDGHPDEDIAALGRTARQPPPATPDAS